MSKFDYKLRDLFNLKDTEDNDDSTISSIDNDDTNNNKFIVIDKDNIEEQTCKPVTKIIYNNNDNYEPITSQDIKFVLDTISKQAPYDKIQINQIFYGICSSQTSTKIHHNINSKKSGEGKSYLLKLVVDLFPDSFVLKFNNMSDKALYHQRGIEWVKNEETGKYEELSPILFNLESEIEEIEEKIEIENTKGQQKDKQTIKSYKSQIKGIEDKIKDLKLKAVKVIDLDDKAFVFLDTPNEGLFNNLMSLLSQDSRDQFYIFTDKDSSGKHLQTRTVLLRGSPLIMTTQVVDDTRNYRFQEKNRRFIHVNPNTTEDKFGEAMRQKAIILGGLPDEFDSIVPSKNIEKSKEIIEKLCKKLKDHNQKFLENDIKTNGVKIPYALILSSNLSTSDSWSMTILDRLLNYIAIITKVNMESRPRLVDTQTGVYYLISIYDDLKEALEIMETASLSIRPYQQDWLTNVFLPAFGELGAEPNCKISESYGTVIARESVVGLTSKQIVDKMSQLGFDASISNVYENYFRPLIKQGLINYSKSVLNGKENLYYPANNISDTENSLPNSLLPLTEDCRLILNKPFEEKNILEESFVTLLGRRSNEAGDGSKYKIIDIDRSELSLDDLIEKYFFNQIHHTSCSVIFTKSYNNTIEHYSIPYEQMEYNIENEDEKKEQFAADEVNKVIDNSIDITISSSSTNYPYTKEEIDNFFASDNGQEEEHTLEESICRPLIGQQTNKPYFLYCKIDPKVENINLKSIEDHIRLKDPEKHKAKLLELLDEEKRQPN